MTIQPHRNTVSLVLVAIVAFAAFAAGCDRDTTTSTSGSGGSGASSSGSAATGPTTSASGSSATAGAKEAAATLEPSKAPGQDNVAGTIHFSATATGVKVHAVVTGLTPNGKHGFHIHEKGDLSAPDLSSAGGHFNAGGHKHGGSTGQERHGGDLGNLEADASGKATYNAMIEGLSIDDARTGVVGKSVIVHEKADDLKTDPAGDSGARIAGGVIKAGGDGHAGHDH